MASIKPASDLPTLLRRSHARIYRIALTLCGHPKSAELVVEKVLRQSQNISRRWETDEDAERWFMHYTVLLCRTVRNRAANNALLTVVSDSNSIAIIKAIRHLPMQQREAFLLHHGEGMDLRQMATAMDCSSAAAANHLVAAVKALRELQLAGIGDFTARLPDLLRQLVPTADAMNINLQRAVAAQRRRDWVRWIVFWSLRLILTAGCSWLAWWIWTRVEIV